MAYNTSLVGSDTLRVITPDNEQNVTKWYWGETLHCGYTPTRSARALMHGDTTAYQYAMFRLRYSTKIHERCRIFCNDRYFVIDSFVADKRANEIQIVATEVSKFKVYE